MMEEDNGRDESPPVAAEDSTKEITQKFSETAIVDQLQDAAKESETSLKTAPAPLYHNPMYAHSSGEQPLVSPSVVPITPASPASAVGAGTTTGAGAGTAPLTSPLPPPAQLPQFTGNPYSMHAQQSPQVNTNPGFSATAATGSPLFYNPGSSSPTGPQPQIYTPSAMPQQTPTALGISPAPGYGAGSPAPAYPQSPPVQHMPHFTPAQTQAAAHAPYGSSSIDLPLDTGGSYQPQQEYNYNADGNGVISGVMNKIKNSVEAMIIVLDPGMKQYIRSGGDIDIIVASDKENKVGPVREAFQAVFGKATVNGIGSQANIAAQPVGFTAGVKGAEERIENLRRSGVVDERQAILSIESFLAEVIPDKWFDIGCLILKDPLHNISLQVFTQATPVPAEYIQQIQDGTPEDYPLRWSGYSITIGEIMSRYMPHVPRSEWHMALTGVSRKEMVFTAAKTMAGLYRQRVPPISS